MGLIKIRTPASSLTANKFILKSLHVEVVLQVIKAFLHRIFVTIHLHGLYRILNTAGEQCLKSGIPADMTVDSLGIEGNLHPALRCCFHGQELFICFLVCWYLSCRQQIEFNYGLCCSCHCIQSIENQLACTSAIR